jgi:hypothetical protein
MHHCGKSKTLLKTWKLIRAGEVRNTLKLGSTSPSPISLLTLSDERQKKTVNPTLKGYGSTYRNEQ